MTISEEQLSQLSKFLEQDLVSRNHFIGGPNVPVDATVEQFSVFKEARVNQGADGEIQVKYIYGPGFFLSGTDTSVLAQQALDRARAALAWLADLPITVGEGAEVDIADEVKNEIRRICGEFLTEKRRFVDEIGKSDPEEWAVLNYALLEVVDKKTIKVVWVEGPGKSLLDPDFCAEDLTGEVVERIKRELPSLKDMKFLLEYDDDGDDDYDGYEDGEYEDDYLEDDEGGIED